MITSHKEKIKESRILDSLKLKKYHFYLVSVHREENVDSDKIFSDLVDSLNEIAREDDPD